MNVGKKSHPHYYAAYILRLLNVLPETIQARQGRSHLTELAKYWCVLPWDCTRFILAWPLKKNSVCKNCAWIIIERQFFLHSVTQKWVWNPNTCLLVLSLWLKIAAFGWKPWYAFLESCLSLTAINFLFLSSQHGCVTSFLCCRSCLAFLPNQVSTCFMGFCSLAAAHLSTLIYYTHRRALCGSLTTP